MQSVFHNLDLMRGVAEGRNSCPACMDTKLDDQNRNCLCVFFRKFYQQFNATVPLHYRDIRLKDLRPSSVSYMPKEKQAALIQKIKQQPDESWAFFGPIGWSKTTYEVALYRHALQKVLKETWQSSVPQSVWRVSAKQLMDEYHMWVTNRERVDDKGNANPAPVPTVTREKIVKAAQAGFVPRLFLAEIDKFKMSKFKNDSMFEVIDAIYENDGQLVLGSNMTMDELNDPNNFGPHFGRRIMENCNVEDYHTGESFRPPVAKKRLLKQVAERFPTPAVKKESKPCSN